MRRALFLLSLALGLGATAAAAFAQSCPLHSHPVGSQTGTLVCACDAGYAATGGACLPAPNPPPQAPPSAIPPAAIPPAAIPPGPAQ
jgi:hypothetical protein